MVQRAVLIIPGVTIKTNKVIDQKHMVFGLTFIRKNKEISDA